MDYRLQEANIRKTEEGVTDVLRRLTVLRETWAEMLQQGGGPGIPAPIAPPSPEPVRP